MAESLRLGVLATHPIQYQAPLFRALTAAGVDLTVFFAHRPTAEEQGAGFGVPFHWDVDLTAGYRHAWLGDDGRDEGAVDLEVAIGRHDFDAFLVMGWHSRVYWQAMTACWRSRVPLLVRGDSQLRHDGRLAKRLAKRALYPHFMRRFAVCLSVGTRSEEYFRYYGAREVVRAPHFVDNAFFATRSRSIAPDRERVRAQWKIPADATVCLFAGKLVEKKRPRDLIAAMARLRDSSVVALVVGDGELRAACEADARAAGAAVRFAGFLNQTEIPRAYVACDVLVLPSDARETWGLVVNEAMASGRPAVVSEEVGCAPDLIQEGRTGHAYPLGDVDRLAAILGGLAGDRERLCAMSRRAAEHVLAYSVDAAVGGILDGARRAAAGGKS